MVKSQRAMWETRLRSLGWKDSLEEGMATDSIILAWRIPWTEEPGRAAVHGVAKSRTQLSNQYFHTLIQGMLKRSGSVQFSKIPHHFSLSLSVVPSSHFPRKSPLGQHG